MTVKILWLIGTKCGVSIFMKLKNKRGAGFGIIQGIVCQLG
jgi:hypothetical protein